MASGKFAMPVLNIVTKQTTSPRYKGEQWTGTQLPQQRQPWLLGKQLSVKKDRYHRASYQQEFSQLGMGEPWQWPKNPIYFITDMHGDADAFIASLVATGVVKKTGPRDQDIHLTRSGRKGKFLIGGDCFDKGPSTLRLLRVIKLLIDRGGKVILLAGNHDVRMLLGIHSIDLEADPRTDHFFIRMGPKMVPFLKEIQQHYLQHKGALQDIPNNRECRRVLYPPKRWFKDFPEQASWVMPEPAIESEIVRLRKKITLFDKERQAAGLSLRMSYAAAMKWKQLFLHPKGEFAWFYQRMQLCYQTGSFLFMHAGIDDQISLLLKKRGWKYLNKRFRKLMFRDPFDFYYGPFANIIRTKYRHGDRPLTRNGIKWVQRTGVRALIHGHRNLRHGQRLMLRKGLLNVECDTTLNRNTRRKLGNKQHPAAAVTIIRPEGEILGISNDYPYIKVFNPSQVDSGKQ
ncbi:MAG TPA: metallophosphoesterase [Gammaproteobacteria bacterium]|nr:metallophosphoesterase [Gammaproteobacteria bacterium]MBT7140258.1 metallophosphoesterase [Gammaproteobacteria bacterium]HIJ23719.1 metallophosphoesterase [Gammaproteobacteria bacterium]